MSEGKQEVIQKNLFHKVSLIVSTILLIVIPIGGIVGVKYLGEYEKGKVVTEATADLNTLTASIVEKLETPADVVRVLALNPYVSTALITGSKEDIARVDTLLDRYKREFSFSACYLIDKTGTTIASSNRNTKSSFVGKNYAFRPYFKKALEGGQGSYFALGITSLKRGYYTSFAVRGIAGNIIGVTVIKKELDEAERIFRNYRNSFLVSPEGVVFLSGDQKNLFKSLWRLSESKRQQLIESRQFGDGPFENIFSEKISAGDKVRLDKNSYIAAVNEAMLGWKVVALRPADSIFLAMLSGGLLTAFLFLIVFFFATYIRLTDRFLTQLLENDIKLEQANARLRELDSLKSMFIASMSHELRTPLNSIIGFTDIILEGISGDINKDQRKELNMVKNSANHLLTLINDVIDVSKIEAGKVELIIKEFDLTALINEVKKPFEIVAGKKGLKLYVQIPESIMISSDETRVKQIIMNFVSNAVKFTERGEIKITAVKKDKSVEVSVSDTGIGIERKNIEEKLFKSFSRISIHGRPKVEGTGLGLYLSSRIANLLGGQIKVKSKFGGGSVFTITLPLKTRREQNEKNSGN